MIGNFLPTISLNLFCLCQSKNIMNHFPPEILQMSVLIDGILNKVEVILINEKLICFHLITVFNSFSFCEKNQN